MSAYNPPPRDGPRLDLRRRCHSIGAAISVKPGGYTERSWRAIASISMHASTRPDCLQEGSLDQAETLFREAVERNPNSADAHANWPIRCWR